MYDGVSSSVRERRAQAELDASGDGTQSTASAVGGSAPAAVHVTAATPSDGDTIATTGTATSKNSGEIDKKPRPTACSNCHTAKVKCDKEYPCSRCVRLDMASECVPHISQQGKGRKRRRVLKKASDFVSQGSILGRPNGSGGIGVGIGVGVGDGTCRTGKTSNRRVCASAAAAAAESAAVIASSGGNSSAGTSMNGAIGGVSDVLALSLGQGNSSGGGRITGGSQSAALGSASSHADHKGIEETLEVSATSLGPSHFGLRHLLRTWVAFAVRRRSFSLLAKASTLAAKTGVTMDNIFCGEDDSSSTGVSPSLVASQQAMSVLSGGVGTNSASLSSAVTCPMTFLLPAFLTPHSSQEVDNTPLSWAELPSELLTATGCHVALTQHRKSAGGATLAPPLGSRWIFVRSLHQGKSRYFVSPAFERDIVSWAEIQSTWNANQREVISLFIPKAEMPAHTRGIMHQFSIHPRPGMPLRANRYRTKIKVRTAVATAAASSLTAIDSVSDSTVEIPVDGVMCQKMVDLDTAYLFIEYVRDEISPASVLARLSASAAGSATGVAAQQCSQSSATLGLGMIGSCGNGSSSGNGSIPQHNHLMAQVQALSENAFQPQQQPQQITSTTIHQNYSRGSSNLSARSLTSDVPDNISSSVANAPGGAGSGLEGLDFFDLDGNHASLAEMDELLSLIRQCQ